MSACFRLTAPLIQERLGLQGMRPEALAYRVTIELPA
jgi:hypothetical protein